MNLPKQYDYMRQAALHQFERAQADVDLLIDDPQDRRRGISLLARPPARITALIETIMANFRQGEPDQYYYPAADMHLTILSIISCYSGFTLELIDPAQYQEVVRRVLRQVGPFQLSYTGLTASPDGVMVQGIPHGDSLTRLRDQLRQQFQRSGLQQSIDRRYRLQTAHSTVLRFRAPLVNPAALVENIRRHQGDFIGSFEVDTLELVFNDWYQRAANTVLLEKYSLPQP